MNKKLLFGLMSLAALAACTNDDFDSQQVAEGTSPIQFEVINNNASMRASMDEETGNTVVWNVNDGDLFTLYHGGTVGATNFELTGYENATYKSTKEASSGTATLTTPSMIKQGPAIMIWPVDTIFRATVPAGELTIKIPVVQGGKDENGKEIIQHQIPYVSDLLTIQPYADYKGTTLGKPNENVTAGKDRKYKIYMRPMASQLNLKADYGNTYATIQELEAGEDGIDPIKVTSVDLLTTTGGGATNFTREIPLKFTAKSGADNTRWNTAEPNNAWSHVTGVDVNRITAGVTATDGQTDKLTTKCLTGNDGCKFLILPQANMAAGVADAGIVVNTIYGKVVIADPTLPNPHKTKYSATEYAAAWYRYLPSAQKITTATTWENISATSPETEGDNAGLFKTVAKSPALGMAQTINYMSAYVRNSTTSIVNTEPMGCALNRYVNVLLTHLDMSDLHIKTDKQLRDAARVWKKMGLDDVTVYLDGDANNEFEISQKTIKVINEINAAVAGKDFKVQPCNVAGEACSKIVITGGGAIQDLAFIKFNDTDDDATYTPGIDVKADVIFKADQNWKWNGTVTVATAATTGINQFINKGTMENAADATLAIYDDVTPTAAQVFAIPLINDGTWKVTAGTLRVQFNVTNNGKVNIAKNAQYRQDGQNAIATKTTFTNEATDKPSRFTYTIAGDDTKIGKVVNEGIFATIGGADINNYGLIEHADNDAKTYITTNQTAGASFNTAFAAGNKMGRINLPYSNKNEDNVSVSAALAQGFVSVTVNNEVTGALDASVVGSKVNYVIINKGITEIKAVSDQVKYLEINQPGTEIAWNVPNTTVYDGLIVLSDVNIKLGTKIIATTTYLGADMYVGGKFNIAAIAAETPDPAYGATNFSGYYGNTTGNVATKYITY